MKSYLIIGMGKFGRYLTLRLAKMGHEIVIADLREDKVSRMAEHAVSAKVGDCTHPDVLKSFGVNHFDACVVCIGDNFQSSLEITDLLKELGARYVVSMAATDTQAKFLLRTGADEIVFPERDIAERFAVSLSNDSVFEYFELSGGYSIYEIASPRRWIGHTILSQDVRNRHRISILAIKKPDGAVLMPSASYAFTGEDHLMVMGKDEDIQRLVRHEG